MATVFLKAKNNAESTLTALVGAADTSLPVADGAKFPATFPFHVSIESEIIRVDGKSGNTLTPVVRAREGTSAASHASGLAIEELITAQVVTEVQDAIGVLEGIDYLVGTAQAALSAEIVAGPTPGGELGGTWAAPTVDGVHSGSAHHAESHPHASHTALGIDDHTQYALLAGRGGGQTLIGGTAAGNLLTLRAQSLVTNRDILLADTGDILRLAGVTDTAGIRLASLVNLDTASLRLVDVAASGGAHLRVRADDGDIDFLPKGYSTPLSIKGSEGPVIGPPPIVFKGSSLNPPTITGNGDAGGESWLLEMAGFIFIDAYVDFTGQAVLRLVPASAMVVGGAGDPQASASLDLAATNKALLINRLTTAQRDLLTAANGMLLYNSTLVQFQGRRGASWVSLLAQADQHDLLSGLLDDDHTQYALLSGRGGGQTLQGGTATGQDLTLRGNSFTLDGSIFLGSSALCELRESTGQLLLPTVGSGAGLLLGGDVQLFRSGANTLRLDSGVADGYMALSGTTQTFGPNIRTVQFLVTAAPARVDFINAIGGIVVRFADTSAGGPQVEFATGQLNVNENIDISGHIALGAAAAVPTAAGAVLSLRETATSTGDIASLLNQQDVTLTVSPDAGGVAMGGRRGLYLTCEWGNANSVTADGRNALTSLQFLTQINQSVDVGAAYGAFGQVVLGDTGISAPGTATPRLVGNVFLPAGARGLYGQFFVNAYSGWAGGARNLVSSEAGARVAAVFGDVVLGVFPNVGNVITLPRAYGGIFLLRTLNFGAGTCRVTVTEWTGVQIDPSDQASGGGVVVTTGIGLQILAWGANATYTNGPYGISQEGDNLNWIRGTTQFGGASRPTAIAEGVLLASGRNLRINGGGNSGYVDMGEFGTTGDAAAPADNRVRIYCRDNGAGKEQLVARFATGAVQILATEP